jgi:ubiquinone/menaquinone biosynthesis C-methylase UbiE
VGLDISAPTLQRAQLRINVSHRDRVEFVEGSIERLPFGGGEFDLCVCFNGLHRVPDPAALGLGRAAAVRIGFTSARSDLVRLETGER